MHVDNIYQKIIIYRAFQQISSIKLNTINYTAFKNCQCQYFITSIYLFFKHLCGGPLNVILSFKYDTNLQLLNTELSCAFSFVKSVYSRNCPKINRKINFCSNSSNKKHTHSFVKYIIYSSFHTTHQLTQKRRKKTRKIPNYKRIQTKNLHKLSRRNWNPYHKQMSSPFTPGVTRRKKNKWQRLPTPICRQDLFLSQTVAVCHFVLQNNITSTYYYYSGGFGLLCKKSWIFS